MAVVDCGESCLVLIRTVIRSAYLLVWLVMVMYSVQGYGDVVYGCVQGYGDVLCARLW